MLPAILVHGTFDFTLFALAAISFTYKITDTTVATCTYVFNVTLTIASAIYAYRGIKEVNSVSFLPFFFFPSLLPISFLPSSFLFSDRTYQQLLTISLPHTPLFLIPCSAIGGEESRYRIRFTSLRRIKRHLLDDMIATSFIHMGEMLALLDIRF